MHDKRVAIPVAFKLLAVLALNEKSTSKLFNLWNMPSDVFRESFLVADAQDIHDVVRLLHRRLGLVARCGMAWMRE